MLKAVIFDFDGVITDSEVLHFRAFNEALKPLEVEISRRDYYRDYLGLSDDDFFVHLAKNKDIILSPQQVAEITETKQRTFERLAKIEGHIIEGVFDFLQMLKQNRVRMAVCSGSLLSEIEMILEQAWLRPFFEVIVSADQVNKSKPDPESFVLTLEKLNQNSDDKLQAADCVVIEDSHWGLDAAIAAGMHTVAITNSYDADQLTQAEKIITHLSELTMPDLEEICK